MSALVPVAVSSDQLWAAAIRARAAADGFEAVAGGMAGEHDPLTRTETTEAMEAMEAYARLAEEAARAGAIAADLAVLIPAPQGRDPELERMELIVSFHESGHAIYAAQSKLLVPVSAEIDVERTLWVGPVSCSGLVMALFTRPPQKWKEKDFVDNAACSLAGTAAEAYWSQRVEGADYDQVKQEAYATHSGIDYGDACDSVGAGTEAFRKAERMALDVVVEQWDHIAGMAGVLREQDRMNRGQISRAA